jgi:uncharacterized protein with HEPN domain
MDRNDPRLTLHLIVKEADDIAFLLKGITYDEFNEDMRTQKAVCLSLLNIGELTKRLSMEFRESHPEIPWRRMTGLRDYVAHQYDAINFKIVYDTAIIEIPYVFKAMLALLTDKLIDE